MSMDNSRAMEEAWKHIGRESSLLEGEVPDVLVVIATIHGREALLERALLSIREEEVPFAVIVQKDSGGKGPAEMRNRAVDYGIENVGAVQWIAFLDDDDEFDPGHLTRLVRHAEETKAQVVYPWFHLNVGGRIDNSRGDNLLLINGEPAFGHEFDGAALDANNYIPVTALVSTVMFTLVGGFPRPGSEEWPHADCEDWGLWRRLRDYGATFSHLPERTWTWHWHGKNTSGRPDRAASIYGGGS